MTKKTCSWQKIFKRFGYARLRYPHAVLTMMPIQFPLDLNWQVPHHVFSTYVTGNNQLACQSLLQVISGGDENVLYLWGPTGLGKTHLLQAACAEVANRQGVPAYLPLSQLRNLPIEAIEGMDQMDLVCFDDMQSIAGLSDWEDALFCLFNQLRETNTPLLISGNAAPQALGLGLPDLVSRLSWGGVFLLEALSDEDTLQVLKTYAAGLGLALTDPVANYLMSRCSRDLKILIAWLDRLDYASLSCKHRLTVPFVREILDGHQQEVSD